MTTSTNTYKMEISDIITQTNKLIKAEFGLNPPSAKIKRGDDTFYDPRENTVYLKKDAEECDIIHEFYGHALFAEQSSVGSHHIGLLKELTNLEDEMGLPHNTTFIFKEEEGKLRIEKNTLENSDCEYIVHFNSEDKKAKEYIKLRQESTEFYKKINPVHEGFAQWMETMILEQLGLNSQLEKRLKLFEDTISSFKGFKADEKRMGRISVLYELGFPKSSEQEIVRRFTQENLGDLSQFKFVVLYGSGKRDIDIMAVGGETPRKTIYTVHFDSVIYSNQEFEARLKLFDLETTGALLTGKCLVGDAIEFEKLKEKIKSERPCEKAVEYAIRKSLNSFNSAIISFHQNQFYGRETIIFQESLDRVVNLILNQESTGFAGKELLSCLNNTSYALSYMLSGLYYKQEKQATTFEELLCSNNTLKEIVKYIKAVEKKDKNVSEEKASNILNSMQQELVKLLREF